jgi:hypothetical protein
MRSILALALATVLAATSQAQNGNSGSSPGAAKQRDRLRARVERRVGPGDGRHVGPQLDGRNARPGIHDRGPRWQDRGPDEARRRAGLDHDQLDDRGDRDVRDRDAGQRFRQRLAAIDRLRDEALERGDLDLLYRADALEQQLRQERRQEPTVADGPGRAGQRPDPDSPPPGHDPNWLPPGIDPNNLPPGLLRAMQQRFHGRLLHQQDLPPGQEAPGAGLPGRLTELSPPLPPPPTDPAAPMPPPDSQPPAPTEP